MEDFTLAADARLDDWDVLQKGQRKVAAIHMGGIYIECLLKGMICSEYHVVEGSIPRKWEVDGVEYPRPSHNLKADVYSDILTDIYDDMSDEIDSALEYVNKPENIEYINYRYMPDSDVSQENYDKWHEEFIKLFNYLQDKKHEM